LRHITQKNGVLFRFCGKNIPFSDDFSKKMSIFAKNNKPIKTK